MQILLALQGFSAYRNQAFIAVVVLVVAMVLFNVHDVFGRFMRDRDRTRFLVYLGGLLLVASFVIRVAYHVVDQVNETTAVLNDTAARVSSD